MTRPVKILHLLSSAQVGGTEMMTLRLVQRMDRQQFESHIAFWHEAGPISREFKSLGFPVTVLNWRPSHTVRVLARLAALLRRERFDLVQVYGLKANLMVRPVAALLGRPLFVTAQRSIDADRRPWHSWADRLTSFLVDLYLCNCQAAADILARRERISTAKLAVVHNGLDPQPFLASLKEREVMRAELGVQPGVPLICVVANLRAPKGHSCLLEALGRLRDDQHWQAVLVGDGPLRGELEVQTRELAIAERVKFAGRRRDIPRVLAAADVFVLPSLWEGLPGAIMEAMATGLPVVASNVGGINELVVDGSTGYLVPAAQPGPLADRIRRLIQNADLRERMGAAGRHRLVNHFSLDDMVLKTSQLYMRLLQRQSLQGVNT